MICYKFTTAQNAFWTLFDKRMKASRPNEFNDIFEFCPVSDRYSLVRKAMADPDQCRQFYEMERKENDYRKSFEHFKAHDLEPKLVANLPHRELELEDLATRDKVSNYVRVICLSRCSLVYLLWSHYADCHKGCAIGVNVRHECFGESRVNERVRYSGCRPERKWNLVGPAQWDELRMVSITKSDMWRYEREHRLVFPPDKLEKINSHHFVRLNPQAVRRIVYGEQMDCENVGRIEVLLSHSDFSHVRRFKIERDPYSYSIRLVSYPLKSSNPSASCSE